VIHHTQCGTGALADDSFRRRYAQRIGVEESTLREHAVLDPAATVTRDVDRLRSAPPISPRVTVSGHVYDVLTGLVATVIPASSSPDRTVEQAHISRGDDAVVRERSRAAAVPTSSTSRLAHKPAMPSG
jgi:hypothetical protein